MSSQLQAIRRLLKSTVLLNQDGGKISLLEANTQATIKSLHFIDTGPDSFGVKFDLCHFPGDNAFTTCHDLHRACDAIIFCSFKNRETVLIVEVKSSPPNKQDACKQLKAGKCFVDFLDVLLAEYEHESISHWDRRYFVFHGGPRTPLSKAPLSAIRQINREPHLCNYVSVQSGETITVYNGLI